MHRIVPGYPPSQVYDSRAKMSLQLLYSNDRLIQKNRRLLSHDGNISQILFRVTKSEAFLEVEYTRGRQSVSLFLSNPGYLSPPSTSLTAPTKSLISSLCASLGGSTPSRAIPAPTCVHTVEPVTSYTGAACALRQCVASTHRRVRSDQHHHGFLVQWGVFRK